MGLGFGENEHAMWRIAKEDEGLCVGALDHASAGSEGGEEGDRALGTIGTEVQASGEGRWNKEDDVA